MPQRKLMSKHLKLELSATSYVSSDSAKRWCIPSLNTILENLRKQTKSE